MKTLFALLFRRLLVSILLGAAIGYVYGAAIPEIISAGTYGYLLGALGGYGIAAHVFLSAVDIRNATSLQHYLYSTFFALPVWITAVVAVVLLRVNLLARLRAYRHIMLQLQREQVLNIRGDPSDQSPYHRVDSHLQR